MASMEKFFLASYSESGFGPEKSEPEKAAVSASVGPPVNLKANVRSLTERMFVIIKSGHRR